MSRFVSQELRWLFRQMRPLWQLQVLSLVSIVASSLLTIACPLILKWLIDEVLVRKQGGLLLFGTMAYGLSLSGQLAFSYCGFFLSYWALERLGFRVRMGRLRQLHRASAAYHEDHPVGEIQFRLEQDVDRIGELGADMLPTVLRMVAMGVMVLTTMALLDLRLTLLVVPLLPVFYAVQRKYFAELRARADAAQKAMGGISSLLQEHLTGMVQLRLLNRTGFHGRKVARLVADGIQARKRQRLAEIKFSASAMSVVLLGNIVILGYGGHQVIRGTLTVGGLVAFYTFVAQLLGPLMTAVDLQSRIQRVGASIRRILEIGEEEGRAPSVNTTPLTRTSQSAIEFRSVSFSHRRNRPALSDVSFIIERGEKVALVGHSGCGKSTVVQLAAGLYSPDHGAIWVEGKDIRRFQPRRLHSAVALVPQDPTMFAGTLRENLLLGKPEATRAELEDAARLAQLDDVLRRLPAGFDEPLGPLGKKLSGGEKRRVALARAVLQSPRILILDEVTGALDGLTSMLLMEQLEEYRKGRTIVLVSHQQESIAWAERIVVMDHGHILDSGNHAELIERCEVYRRLTAETMTNS